VVVSSAVDEVRRLVVAASPVDESIPCQTRDEDVDQKDGGQDAGGTYDSKTRRVRLR